jgi:hypothetical protein
MSRYEVSWPGGDVATVRGPGVSLYVNTNALDMDVIAEALNDAFNAGLAQPALQALDALAEREHRMVSPTGCSCGEVFADAVLLGQHIGRKAAQS